MDKYITYYRVSTKRQSLGIDAQKEMVKSFLHANGGEVIGEYSEKESGKNDDRPQLTAALSACKESGAILLIAKLDRLSRDLAFILNLPKHGVEFRVCNLPDLDIMNLCVFAGLAQKEREMISDRTRQALAQTYEKPGHSWNDTHKKTTFAASTIEKGLQARQAAARSNDANKRAWALVKVLLENGKTLANCASTLNDNGYKTARGGSWRGNQVKRLIDIYSNTNN